MVTSSPSGSFRPPGALNNALRLIGGLARDKAYAAAIQELGAVEPLVQILAGPWGLGSGLASQVPPLPSASGSMLSCAARADIGHFHAFGKILLLSAPPIPSVLISQLGGFCTSASARKASQSPITAASAVLPDLRSRSAASRPCVGSARTRWCRTRFGTAMASPCSLASLARAAVWVRRQWRRRQQLFGSWPSITATETRYARLERFLAL